MDIIDVASPSSRIDFLKEFFEPSSVGRAVVGGGGTKPHASSHHFLPIAQYLTNGGWIVIVRISRFVVSLQRAGVFVYTTISHTRPPLLDSVGQPLYIGQSVSAHIVSVATLHI